MSGRTEKTAFIVVNDQDLSCWLKDCLEKEGFVSFAFFREEKWTDACAAMRLQDPDLAVLDITAFNSFTFDACREMRAACDGLLFVIMDQENDLGQAMVFELGADDVVARPFSERVFQARLRSHLRRGRGRAASRRQRSISIGGLTVHAGRREALLEGEPLDLTTLQFDLLLFLVRNAGCVVTRDDLYRSVFDAQYNGVDRSIDVYISRLRQKIEEDPAHPSYLKTVRGEGYLFVSGGEG
jgi:two-component system, OmpR family, response regulator RstA